ncbi:MAG: hypothetical protein LC799_32390, partial [Actinobacteria bacterium]|nr:hypothetical protein [Actinomycetota bacterium]
MAGLSNVAGSSERVDVVGEFNDRAPRYDKSAMHRWQARQAAELADVHPDEYVLDVATGTGLVLRALRRASVNPR